MNEPRPDPASPVDAAPPVDPAPPAEGTLEIRGAARPRAKTGSVRSFFFRSQEDASAEEQLPGERPHGWHLERLRAALARSAQRVEEGGEVVWRVPWGALEACLGQVLEEMDRDADQARGVLEDAFRRAETQVEQPLSAPAPAPAAPPAEGGAAAPGDPGRTAQLERDLELRAQEVRYLERRLEEQAEQSAAAAAAAATRAAEERVRAEAGRGAAEAACAAAEAALRSTRAALQAAESEAQAWRARSEELGDRLNEAAEEQARREERAREEEEQLRAELTRLEGLLRALVDELPEGDELPPGPPEVRLAALRALAVELDACARERRGAASLIPLPDLPGALRRVEVGLASGSPGRRERLLALRAELGALGTRWEALWPRARRGAASLPELLELVGLAQRACAGERELEALLG